MCSDRKCDKFVTKLKHHIWVQLRGHFWVNFRHKLANFYIWCDLIKLTVLDQPLLSEHRM